MIHYGVANISGAVARESTFALAQAAFTYAVKIADQGWKKVAQSDRSFLKGITIVEGKQVCQPVSDVSGIICVPAEAVIY